MAEEHTTESNIEESNIPAETADDGQTQAESDAEQTVGQSDVPGNEESVDETQTAGSVCNEEASAVESSEEDISEEASEEDPEEASEEDSKEASVDEQQQPDPETAEEETEEKTGFFGRRKKDKEKEKLKTQLEDLNDKLRRSLAEFDNFRKRTEKEKSSMYIIGAKDIVERMLPVLDSFERGLATANEGDAFAEGMQMIYRQMVKALEEAGVKPIEAVGKTFDPNLHNAVMHVEDEEAGENVIVEEFQKGYTYKDFVVRHSMVKVAN